MTDQPSIDDALNRETARRLVAAVRNFVTSEVGGRAKMLGALLLAFLLGINALNVLNSYVSRYFMTAIERREWSEFVRMAFLYLAVLAALTCVAVLHRFIEERLGLLWRDWLTRRLVGSYLEEHTYHRLNAIGSLGNPDQRIADDVRAFTTSTLSISLIFLNGTFTIIAFSGVLWSISRVLFLIAVGYAALGSLLAIVLGRPLVRLNYDQSDREAYFRSQLIHVRENAEAIALARQEPFMRVRLRGYVDAITTNLTRIIAVNRNLSFFTTGYDYLIQVIPVLVVAPLFIRGETEFGTIPQSSMAFAHLLGAFSLVVKQFPQLSAYAAVLARLTVLVNAVETTARPGSRRIAIVEDPDRLAFDGVTLQSPGVERPSVRELSFEVKRGHRLLIATSSEQVAVALQRAIAGLAESGDGRIVRPNPDEIFFLPEEPYLPPGKLRELLAGERGTTLPDETIWSVLRSLGIDETIRRHGLDSERDWDEALSREEQRLLSLAYALLTRPRFAVLTRLDSSLGAERAAHVIGALARQGTGCILIGGTELARDLFDVMIAIAPDGSWTETRAGSGSS